MQPSHDDRSNDRDLTLVERLPDYLAVFGLGLAASAVAGFVISLIWNVKVAEAIGYTIVLYGVILLLAGGATGGGYTSLGIGAAGALFGGRRVDEASEDLGETWSEQTKKTPRERLREGLRPEANARAFWQVIAGFLYIAIGVGFASVLT